jgi:hypothetical protein
MTKIKVRITQYFDAEVWQSIADLYSKEDLLLCNIEQHQDGDATLTFNFEMPFVEARRLAVLLQMTAALGDPQTGLDMLPSRNTLNDLIGRESELLKWK